MGASPYPLAGESRDVVEDVHRLGGFGIAAHPDSPKTELRWTDWDTPIDGVELLNADTSWRVHTASGGARFPLVRGLFTYLVRPSETIGTLFTDSPELNARWGQTLAPAGVVAVAGADAHAKLVLLDDYAGNPRYWLPFPGYEPSLRVLSVHVRPTAALTGDAAADAAVLLKAIRGGRLYVAIDAWASPPAFEFSASNGSDTAHEGDHLAESGAVSLHVRSNAPSGYLTTVWRDHQPVTENDQQELRIDAPSRDAAYWVTIRDPRRPAAPPWLTSNPIHIGATQTVPARPPNRGSSETVRLKPDTTSGASLTLFDG